MHESTKCYEPVYLSPLWVWLESTSEIILYIPVRQPDSYNIVRCSQLMNIMTSCLI